jgi:hypothetical protein
VRLRHDFGFGLVSEKDFVQIWFIFRQEARKAAKSRERTSSSQGRKAKENQEGPKCSKETNERLFLLLAGEKRALEERDARTRPQKHHQGK